MMFRTLILSSIFISSVFAGPAECWLDLNENESQYVVGDTIELSIWLDTHLDTITAYDFYLTFDPNVFQPVLYDDDPFIPRNFGFDWFIFDNDTHGDVWNSVDNGIQGFQLDYAAFFQPETDTYITGTGIVASFNLVIMNIPDNEDTSTEINFDYNEANVRKTGYIPLSGIEERFSSTVGKGVSIEGFSIYPEIPDTLVLPGEELVLNLDEYFESNVFNPSDAIWTVDVLQPVEGALIELNNDTHQLSLTTQIGIQGFLIMDITLEIPDQTFKYSQNWSIEINHPVQFVNPFPSIIFSEDTEYFLHYDSLFVDEDNLSEELLVWDEFITTNTPIYTQYDDNDSIHFTVEENWSGLANTHLFVQEPLGRIIDTLLVIRIEDINDAPWLDFNGISGDTTLGDTLILFHNFRDTINLTPFVFDIDDNVFTWDIGLNPLISLDVSMITSGQLGLIPSLDTLANSSLDVYVNDGDTTITNSFKIQIRSKPPIFFPVDPILIHADTTYFLDLSTIVLDEDTPYSNLSWEFNFLEFDGNTDEQVDFTFDADSLILAIHSDHLVNDDGIFRITVRENFAFGNIVSQDIQIYYFKSDAPQILDHDLLILKADTLESVLDLDTLIFDYNDSPEEITWTIIENPVFDTTYVDSLEHILFIKTSNEFFGDTTLMLIAENSLFLKDTTVLEIKVIPELPFPQISMLPDKTVYWRSDSTFLFDLDDYIFDSSTEPEQMNWSVVFNSDSLNLIINTDHQVFVTSWDVLGQVSVVFSAENIIHYSTSDTVLVSIVQDEPPQWNLLQSVTMSKFQPQMNVGYRLTNNCNDDLTTSNNLMFSVETNPSEMTAQIDSIGEVTLTLLDTSIAETELAFFAEDEHQNISPSNMVTVSIINGFFPQWTSVPVIRFGNTETYISDCLTQWCEDQDSSPEELHFAVESVDYVNLSAEIFIEDNCPKLLLTPQTIFQGSRFLKLFVTDQQQNETSKLVIVTIEDMIFPEANLTYFISPILSRRLHFILTSDGSVENYNSVPNTFYIDDSLMSSLSFSLMDQQVDLQVWNAPFQFKESGLYKLIVNLTDESDNITIDSLILSVNLPNGEGGTLKSPSGKLSIQYPEYFGNENTVIILDELNRFETTPVDMEETVYAIKSNKLSDIALIVSYSGDTYGSDYFSFYQVINGNNIPLTTFLDDDGIFQSSVPLNSEFYFGKSTKPAEKISIPQNDFLCYPNPFNSKISFFLFISNKEEVNLSVYDITGKRVFDKISILNPGFRKITWDGVDNNSTILPTGIYLVRLSVGEKLFTKKITILK